MTDRWTPDGKIVLLSHSLTKGGVGACSRFGQIPPSGLGGDSVTDRWTDAGRMDGRKNMFSHTLHEG